QAPPKTAAMATLQRELLNPEWQPWRTHLVPLQSWWLPVLQPVHWLEFSWLFKPRITRGLKIFGTGSPPLTGFLNKNKKGRLVGGPSPLSTFSFPYRVDSISNPQASSRGSGMYLEFLLRRAHSRNLVERKY